MSAEKLRRVVWLLRERFPNAEWYSLTELRKAIIEEIGSDERTIKGNIDSIIEVGYLKRLNRHQFVDTGSQY